MTSGRLTAAMTLLGILTATTALLAQNSGATPASKGSLSSLQAVLERREKDGWQAYKNRDRKTYADLVTNDYTAVLVDGHGQRDLPSTLDSMNEVTINSYNLSDFKLTSLGPNAALLRYKAVLNYAIGNGQPQDGKLAVSDVWVRRGGQWKSLYYQETEVR